jgi:WD40 repeat protein/serine/threonine protein kinase
MNEPSESLSLTRPSPPEEADRQLWLLWRQGQRPDLRQFLGSLGTLPLDRLAAVLAVDQHERWQQGDPVPAEKYLEEYPALQADSEKALELIYGEFLLREEQGETLTLEEFARRFPQHAARLEEQVRLHQALTGVMDPPDAAVSSTDAGQPLRYVRIRLHARGGIGQVWVAHDRDLGREVAMKELRPDRADVAAARRRFLNEARITGQLEHPGVVPIYELGLGPAEQQPFYTMRFIRGRTLREASQAYRATASGGMLELRRLLQVFVSVCNTVAYAHARGVIHRDMKGPNVILGDYGEVFVLDWGAAKAFHPSAGTAADTPRPAASHDELTQGVDGIVEDNLTLANQIIGTPAYMAPEQAEGCPDRIGPWTDVYGLGAILFEVLCGIPPHQGDNLSETLQRIRNDETPRVRSVVPSTPAALDAVCAHAMARRPEARYPTATALAEDVQRWLADEPVQAWREPWMVRTRRWLGRHRTRVTSAVAVLVVAAVGLAIGLGLLATANQRELAARQDAERQRDEARLNLYVADLNLAQQAWDVPQVTRVLELLRAHEPGPDDIDRRGFEWYYLWRHCQAGRLTLDGHTTGVAHVTFAPDRKSLISADQDGTVKFWDPTSGKEVRSWAGRVGSAAGLAVSPTGRYLATRGDGHTMRLWDLATGKEHGTLTGHTDHIFRAVFSPDGRRLASVSRDRTVKVWDVETAKEIRTYKGHSAAVTAVAFSPDGRRVVSASYDRTVQLWEADTGTPLRTYPDTSRMVLGVAFSPDGQHIASFSHDQDVKIWKAATGEAEWTLSGHKGMILAVAFSPDGRSLATASWDQTAMLWSLDTGKRIRTFKGHQDAVHDVAFSPDGLTLATAGGDRAVKLWDANADVEPRKLADNGKVVMDIAIDPSGTRIAVAGEEPGLVIRDAATGRLLLTLKGHRGQVTSVAFHPDGQRLASGGKDATVRVWDTRTGKELLRLVTGSQEIRSVAFSPDGTQLAAGGYDKDVHVWDMPAGNEVRSLKGHTQRILALAYSPDGRYLASGAADQTVRVWESASGAEVFSLGGHTTWVLALAFSPDGRFLASAGDSGTLRLWDLATGTELRRLRGQPGVATSVAFSPDGRRVASAASQEVVKFWETVAGQEIFALRGPPSSTLRIAFSPDGKRVLTGGADGTVRVWEARDSGESRGGRGP